MHPDNESEITIFNVRDFIFSEGLSSYGAKLTKFTNPGLGKNEFDFSIAIGDTLNNLEFFFFLHSGRHDEGLANLEKAFTVLIEKIKETRSIINQGQ